MHNTASERPEIWPVIHLQSPSQGITNARLAAKCGCQGVFLISMHGDDTMIDPVADDIKRQLPNLKVGVNYLTKSADKALSDSLAAGHHATWADDAGIRSDAPSPLAHRCEALLIHRTEHLFFAGVAFKYRQKEPDPPRAAARALYLGFLPTTSGAATGSAPDVGKLAGIRAAISPSAPLAVASGITPDNVAVLGPYLSHILVATGVSRSFHDFDAGLLTTLMRNRPLRLSSRISAAVHEIPSKTAETQA